MSVFEILKQATDEHKVYLVDNATQIIFASFLAPMYVGKSDLELTAVNHEMDDDAVYIYL